MINVAQIINTYLGLTLDRSAEDSEIDALLDYLQPAERHETYRPFTHLYVFGDSLSDIGTTFRLTQEALGQGLPPAPPYYTGRLSDGPVWVDYLVRLLKLSNSCQTNFAVAGATTSDANTFPIDTIVLPGLTQQLKAFIKSLDHQEADPEALYIIWAGANDYLGGVVTNPAGPIENLTGAVKLLFDCGARQIMVVNLPDLGNLPGPRKDSQVSVALNALTTAHNAGLSAAIEALRQDIRSDAVDIMLFDVNSLCKQVLNEPDKFDFTNVTDAEMEKVSKFEGYADRFFFWDNVHPTTVAHLTLAKVAVALLAPKMATLAR
jgi:phospholipase/lecithinase/hemolysin